MDFLDFVSKKPEPESVVEEKPAVVEQPKKEEKKEEKVDIYPSNRARNLTLHFSVVQEEQEEQEAQREREGW